MSPPPLLSGFYFGESPKPFLLTNSNLGLHSNKGPGRLPPPLFGAFLPELFFFFFGRGAASPHLLPPPPNKRSVVPPSFFPPPFPPPNCLRAESPLFTGQANREKQFFFTTTTPLISTSPRPDHRPVLPSPFTLSSHGPPPHLSPFSVRPTVAITLPLSLQ